MALCALIADDVRADPAPPGIVWIDISGVDEMPREQPRAFLAPLSTDPDRRYLEILGEAAFRAPEIFGDVARRSGLSCQACHVNGTINPDLFVEGISKRNGGLDATSSLFNTAADDGVFNHRDVPSLRGIRATAPYGRDGRFPTLRAFTEHVIVTEFGGASPPARLLDALIAHQNRIEFNTNPRPAPAAKQSGNAASKRGETLFRRRFANQPELSCAGCHLPDSDFVDRKQHDVGTGGRFDTPTLRGVAETAPYFHDGRSPSLAGVVDHFNGFFELGLSATERADLVAYLAAIGTTERAVAPITLVKELEAIDRLRWGLGEAIKRGHYEDAALIVHVSRRRIGDLHARYDRDHQVTARQAMVIWSRALQGVGRNVEAADAQAARYAFLAYTSAFWEMTRPLIEEAAGARLKIQE